MFKKFWRPKTKDAQDDPIEKQAGPAPNELGESADLYNAIGVAAVQQIGQAETKILVYAETDDGVVRVFVRHAAAESDVVDSLGETRPVNDAVIALIEHLESVGQDHVWKSMEYVVDYGKMDVELLYDAPFAGSDLSLWKKSPMLLEKHFPGKPHR